MDLTARRLCWLRPKQFVHMIDDPDDWQEGEETLAMSTSRNEEEIDALVAKFNAVNSEEGLDEDEAIRSVATWTEPRKNNSSTRLNRHVSSH